MADSIAKKAGAFLSAAVAVSAVLAQHVDAHPAASIGANSVSGLTITRVDDRPYRHCHYLPVRVVCYASLSGTHKTKDPPERKLHQRSPVEFDGRHYRTHHGEPWWE
jgi:hypothetical protein